MTEKEGIRLAVRGFAGRQVVFEEHVTVDPARLGAVLPALAAHHTARMAAHELHMIEIEFLDEPDPLQRYLRIGTDPAGMTAPVRVL